MHWEMESASTQCFSEPAWDIPRSMDPEKDLARKTQVTGVPTGGGLALGLGRGRSAALEPPGDYQLSVEGEIRSR